ncbi:MAG: methionine synthase [Planctomycetota bacterium]|nr:methionine synthase [Planctomycetota bacterium]MDA1105183.1 methionine synthase [Planctomycetota bacterium]
MPTPTLLSRMDRGPVLFDGAMGTAVQACTDCSTDAYLGRENCTDILVRSRPDIVERIHASMLAAGADIVETNTFGANRLVAAEYDQELVGWARSLNVEAARIARKAADRAQSPGRPRFVAGSMGPGTKLITLGNTSWDAMLESYREQAEGLLEGGVDAFIVETCQDLLQIRCAVTACLEAMERARLSPSDRPIFVSVTVETSGTLLLGSDVRAVVNALCRYPVASLGLNCATGPVEMLPHVAAIAREWDRRISVIPNAGLPVLLDGKTHYPLQPEGFTKAMRRFVEELPVDALGGCCGTTPEHIAGIRGLLDARAAGTGATARAAAAPVPAASSLYSAVEFRQDSSFLVVAERLNSNGSRKFKRLLDAEDWDGLMAMAREEVRDGSHVLDVCVDFVGRDGVRDMRELVARLVRQVDAPLMLDSTDARVLRAGLEATPGRCIVNSVNLEDGERRLDEVCPLLRRHGAAVVALTIDEDPQAGMARTAERKLEIATRLHDLLTTKWGISEEDIFFDCLTFTIATGNEDDRRLGLATLDGIEAIAKRFPRCQSVLGVSNISFGLKPAVRTVLNSVFLSEARERGLTAAIVHASKILPRDSIEPSRWDAAHWLLHDLRGERRPAGTPTDFDPLIHFIGLFPDGEEVAQSKATLADLPLDERLQAHIVQGDDATLPQSLDEALQLYSPLDIINNHLLAGMKVVGERFADGRMQLPFVLQSAQVMKKAVALLEPAMKRMGTSGPARAKVVLATVSGDVHDIGKNLVDIILTNNGYKVFNLGIKQRVSQIVEAFRTHEADAIGMSGLLVKSVGVMEENLRELNALGIQVPVMLGGAALTRHYAESHLREIYEGSLYYGRDAFEGLSVCDAIAEGRLGGVDSQIDARLAKRRVADALVAARAERVTAAATAVAERPVLARSTVSSEVEVPAPPFWGSRVATGIALNEIYPFVNRVALDRGQWGFKRGAMDDAAYAAVLREHAEPVFQRLCRECSESSVLRPAVVWGYYPCASEGDDLVVFAPDDHSRELERFSFPRQEGRERLCISDFFRSVESDERDCLGLHCVTMGPEVSERARELFEGGSYTEYLFLHGFGVECAEALAELWHKRIRAELGIAADDSPEVRKLFTQHYRGSRYSFGYPACPDMSDQCKLFRLLQPERIGCTLTENWQIDPEQSTSAIIVHHPQAKYFAV